jgi:hypothetical protein
VITRAAGHFVPPVKAQRQYPTFGAVIKIDGYTHLQNNPEAMKAAFGELSWHYNMLIDQKTVKLIPKKQAHYWVFDEPQKLDATQLEQAFRTLNKGEFNRFEAKLIRQAELELNVEPNGSIELTPIRSTFEY